MAAERRWAARPCGGYLSFNIDPAEQSGQTVAVLMNLETRNDTRCL